MEKKFAICATKQINILTLVLSERKFLNEKKSITPPSPPPPPLQAKWTVPIKHLDLIRLELFLNIKVNFLWRTMHINRRRFLWVTAIPVPVIQHNKRKIRVAITHYCYRCLSSHTSICRLHQCMSTRQLIVTGIL